MTIEELCSYASTFSMSSQSLTIVYYTSEATGKFIDESDLFQLYELMQYIGKRHSLNLVLNTTGGDVEVARRMALLLREYTSTVDVFIVFQALSAGSILSLSADRIVMGSTSRLSPIDPLLRRDGGDELTESSPTSVSSEDVRSFIKMAEDWFDVKTEEARLDLLGLLCQRIFPTTLSRLYRSENRIVQMTSDLLKKQLPGVDENGRTELAFKLIRGYQSHDHSLSKAELKALGLNVIFMTDEDEHFFYKLWKGCDKFITTHKYNCASRNATASSLLFTSDFFAVNEYTEQSVQLSDGMGNGVPLRGSDNWRVLLKKER